MTEPHLYTSTLSPATTFAFACAGALATAATHPFQDQRVRCLTSVASDRRPNVYTTQAVCLIFCALTCCGNAELCCSVLWSWKLKMYWRLRSRSEICLLILCISNDIMMPIL